MPLVDPSQHETSEIMGTPPAALGICPLASDPGQTPAASNARENPLASALAKSSADRYPKKK